MQLDSSIYKKISQVSRDTPDPERAERNLLRLFENLHDSEHLLPYLSEIGGLFSVSQFLARYCIANPAELLSSLKEIKRGITRDILSERAKVELSLDEGADINRMMKILRLFKKRYLLRITLRYLLKETEIQSSMDELTLLAETIVSVSLQWALRLNQQRFGDPSDRAIAIIGLGKLGGEELNYSSDIDLIAVYSNEDGHTSGITGPSGVRMNRVSNHEFYCRVVETLNRILSFPTEDGIVYRVDLRLRPQGQRGDIALSLRAYQIYYESWGRTWERMVLLRARPVAGDIELGRSFMDGVVNPFVWRETLDYAGIEEIRELKKKIDSTRVVDDIKRGYGGIREAEFFVQTFQLLYGGTEKALRAHKLFNLIQALGQMHIVPEEELLTLSENYLFLRQLEHYLQMLDDLQTHTLPSADEEIRALAKKMGFSSGAGFLANLRLRRMQIKNMYNSLLGTEEDVHAEAMALLDGSLTGDDLRAYLSFKGARDPGTAVSLMERIREQMRLFRTQGERDLLREFVPRFMEKALSAEDPDRALSGLESLLSTYGIRTAHMTAINGQKELMMGIVKIFSLSPYLTRIFLSNHLYLDLLIEEWSISKTLRAMEERLKRAVEKGGDFNAQLAGYRRFEEVRMGMLFLLDILKTMDLLRGISHLAEAIIRVIIERAGCKGLSVIALGKLGGREMTFGSDIDIIFLSETPEAMTVAEKIIKTLTTYTDMGLLYNVDTRLRPDGSKGALVNNMEGYRDYYLKKARNWEVQALLRARHVAGDESLGRSFMRLAGEVIRQRGPEIERKDIQEMRDRIVRELSHETEGIDIKLGSGGIEEIEFYIQFLQLRYAPEHPEVLVQSTPVAINRLARAGLLSQVERDTLYNAYEYYRKLETFLKLNEEHRITPHARITRLSARFMGHRTTDEFMLHLKKLRGNVLTAIHAPHNHPKRYNRGA